jgi:hypothetical protein
MGASIATIAVLLCSSFVDASESSTIDKCTNDPNYRFKGKEDRDCDWVWNKRGGRYCYKDKYKKELKEHCPLTCGECCKDDPNFKFSIEKSKKEDCEWVREKEYRRTEWCKESDVKDACVLSCTFCQGYGSSPPSLTPTLTPVPSLTPSSEPSEPPPPTSTPTLTLAPSSTPSSEPSEPPPPSLTPTLTLAPSLTPSSEPSGTPITKPPTNASPQDPHGITMIYASQDSQNPQSFKENDWVSKWETYTQDVELESVYDVDPNDNRLVLRGNGDIIIKGDGSGELLSEDSPRAYITAGGDEGWEDVEFTAYGKYIDDSMRPKSYSGLTLVARTSHSLNKASACNESIYAGKTCSPCKAAGYYARIYKEGNSNGETSFQKEYYHGTSTVYSASRRVKYFPNNQLPLDTWIGMKFIVYTIPNTNNVKLELYADTTDGENGGTWIKIHEMTDEPGSWKATKNVPSTCSNVPFGVPDGSTILGERDDCFLRSDSSNVLWKKASVRRISENKLDDN